MSNQSFLTTHAPIIRIEGIANPSAGQNFAFTPVIPQQIEILGVQYTLTTSATALNRLARVAYSAGGSLDVNVMAPATQPASTAIGYTFGIGLSSPQTVLFSGTAQAPLIAGVRLSPGQTFESSVFALQIGDQISGITIILAEWREPFAT